MSGVESRNIFQKGDVICVSFRGAMTALLLSLFALLRGDTAPLRDQGPVEAEEEEEEEKEVDQPDAQIPSGEPRHPATNENFRRVG